MRKDIKKALEHCVEWKCDNCPNGDDLGSGETVCRGRLLPQVLEYVADLEAKLAESNESHHKNIVELTKIATEKDRKIEELKHQLVEKEELIMFADRTIKGLVLAKEIDKVSFAVEKLEKVKDEIDDINYFNSESECNVVDSYEIWSYIDNQIKELKEMK